MLLGFSCTLLLFGYLLWIQLTATDEAIRREQESRELVLLDRVRRS